MKEDAGKRIEKRNMGSKAAGISYCLNQKRFIEVLPVREKSEILEGTEKVSVRTSDVKEFGEKEEAGCKKAERIIIDMHG